jgi:exosortase/archaeosortase family protein
MSDSIVQRAQGKVFQRIIVVASITFIILPFVTTFNEFLTKVVESFELVALIQGFIAPFIVRIVAVLLRTLGVPVSISGSNLFLTGGWMPLRVYINWNCIGWQSFVLLAFTFLTGLQGPYTRRSKLMTVLIGLEGTFLLNILRILIPTLLAGNSGYLQAILFHDYLGTLFTLLWMGIFWNYVFENLLLRRPTEMDGEDKAPTVSKRGIFDEIISGELGKEK